MYQHLVHNQFFSNKIQILNWFARKSINGIHSGQQVSYWLVETAVNCCMHIEVKLGWRFHLQLGNTVWHKTLVVQNFCRFGSSSNVYPSTTLSWLIFFAKQPNLPMLFCQKCFGQQSTKVFYCQSFVVYSMLLALKLKLICF